MMFAFGFVAGIFFGIVFMFCVGTAYAQGERDAKNGPPK